MFDATRYTPDNDAVDWRALADEFFPAEALLTSPAVTPFTMLRNSA